MNDAIKKNNQLLRDQQKYEFSLFAVQILASIKNNICKYVCQVLFHTCKKLNWALQPKLDEHTFFDFHVNKSKYMANINAHATFCITNTVPSNARLNPNFKMTLDKSHNANLTLK